MRLMAGFEGIDKKAKLLSSVIFILLTAAVVTYRVSGQPTGPWGGMYVGFWKVWFFSLSALVFLIFTISKYDIPWGVPLLCGIIFCNIVIALTLSWNIPFGYFDIWTHLMWIKQQKLNPSMNPYPSLHIFVILQSKLFGLPIKYTFSRITVIASTNGVLLITIAIRQVLASKKSQQLAVIASIPMVFVGFNVRPFTLAWPFAFLLWWLIIGGISEPLSRFLMLILAIPFLLLHPHLIAFGLVFIGWAWLLSNSSLYHLDALEINSVWRNKLIPIVSLVALFILHAFIINNTGVYLSGRFVSQILSDIIDVHSTASGSSPTTPGSPPTASGPTSLKEGTRSQFFRLLSHLSELLRRFTYLIALGIISVLTVYTEFHQRRLSYTSTVVILSSLTIVLLFVLIDLIIKSSGISVLMIVWVLPVVLLPLVPHGFDLRPKWRGVFAAIVLLAGISVAFPSTYTGGVVHSTSGIEIEGYEWVKNNHNDKKIVNTKISSKVAFGLWGENPWPSASNKEKYSWQAIENSSYLYIVDGLERTKAFQEAAEKNDYSSIHQLWKFRTTNHRVYQNGAVSIFTG